MTVRAPKPPAWVLNPPPRARPGASADERDVALLKWQAWWSAQLTWGDLNGWSALDLSRARRSWRRRHKAAA